MEYIWLYGGYNVGSFVGSVFQAENNCKTRMAAMADDLCLCPAPWLYGKLFAMAAISRWAS